MSLQLKPVGMLTSWKTGLKIEHLWTLLPFVFLIVVTFGTPLRLLDFWWHLKMGEVIVTSFDLPETDIFSFTSGEKPFLLQSWLAEVALYLLYLVGGLRLIVAGNVAVLTLALLAVYASCRRHLAAPRLCALISVPLIVPLVIYSNVRPQTFSILLFAVFLRSFERVSLGEPRSALVFAGPDVDLGQPARGFSSGSRADRDLLAGHTGRRPAGE